VDNYLNQAGIVRQLFCYGSIGLLINITGYLVYLVITSFGMPPKYAMSILYGAGVIVGFIANRKLTFGYDGKILDATIRYFFVHCIGYLINLFLHVILVDEMGYPHQWVQGLAIIILVTFLFLSFRFFVFRQPYFLSSGK